MITERQKVGGRGRVELNLLSIAVMAEIMLGKALHQANHFDSKTALIINSIKCAKGIGTQTALEH